MKRDLEHIVSKFVILLLLSWILFHIKEECTQANAGISQGQPQ